jgi:Flp pilus assembly protein TadG
VRAFSRSIARAVRRRMPLLADGRGSQILEFAVSLPLLMVFVVGIFDFGGAFNLKQKLNNAAREGARYASGLPTNDLNSVGTPPSVTWIRDVVDKYLQETRVDDCGLSTQAPTNPSAMTWRYTASGGACPAPLTLTLERYYSFQTAINGNTINVISTRVSLSYPYRWHFNKVITTLVPGATYAGITQITTDAVVPNMD